MKQENKLMTLISASIQEQDSKALEKYAYELNLLVLKQEDFWDSIFEFILSTLNRSEFQNMPGSFHLIKVLEYDIDRLSEKQKATLLEMIENTFDNYVDGTSCLLLAEYAASIYANERSLQALRNLRRAKNDTARALVPSGFEYFVQLCKKKNLVELAKEELRHMLSDPSELVRQETQDSLRRVEVKPGRKPGSDHSFR